MPDRNVREVYKDVDSLGRCQKHRGQLGWRLEVAAFGADLSEGHSVGEADLVEAGVGAVEYSEAVLSLFDVYVWPSFAVDDDCVAEEEVLPIRV